MDLLEYVNSKIKENSKEIIKEPRDKRISMRVTKSEKELIDRIASESNLTITELFIKLINDNYKK